MSRRLLIVGNGRMAEMLYSYFNHAGVYRVDAFAVVHPWSRLGDDVYVGAGSIVGHHGQLRDHAYLALHAVVAGSVVIGERAFVGAGATIRDNVNIGAGSVIGAGATILGDVEPNTVHAARPARPLPMRGDQARI